jgi:uncharacterized membrane protein
MVFVKTNPKTILNFLIFSILAAVAISIGFFFFIIPGIILTAMLLPAPFLIIDREMGTIEAIKESVKITTGHIVDILTGVYIGWLVAGFLLFTLILYIPMTLLISVYPYLQLTGQLEEVQKKLEANG